jgi:Amt family ammonium transporter
MVWFWPGPDAFTSAEAATAALADSGWLFQKGVLDFAGGTVVHINAGVAGIVGAYLVGKRIGYGKEPMTPHSLTMTMIGASLLWVGWFGFNAGSALEAGGTATLAFANTLIATAAAVLAWLAVEWLVKGKPSLLGAASGAVAGLVAITPACGWVGIGGGLAIGAAAGIVCFWGVTGLKKLLGADDALDVFGIHAVGGILGALLTGVFNTWKLGGTGIIDYVNNTIVDTEIGTQVWIQAQGVLTSVIWSGVVAFICYKIVDLTIGLRVPEEAEREGLDITTHGERAYTM